MQTLSPQQVQRLFDHTKDDRLHALWVLLITSGLRIGEATALTWDDVDLDRGSVSIRRTIQRLKGRGLVVGEPKTARSRRTVYLPSGTVAALHFHEDRQKIERKKAQNLWQNRNLVFCTAVGGPIDPSTVNPALHRRLKAAGLPRLRVHDLRHTAATYLLSLGVHPKVVQDMLGHSSIALTLNTYSHVVPALHREAAGQMERLFSGPADAPDGPVDAGVDARDGISSLGHPDAV
jgi:integrase